MIRILPKPASRLPWRPWDEFDTHLRRLMERFEESLESEFPQLGTWSPAVELIEKDNEFVLTAELPSLTKDDIEIEVGEDVLTIRGEKKEEHEEKKPRYHVWERSYGRFQREFNLPRTVDPKKISAEFENGILTVRMPRTSETRTQKVEIAAKK